MKLQFNRYAPTYDQHAVAQKRMAYRLIQTLIELVPQPQNILEIGCGTGFMTQLLCEHYPSAQITTIDMAKKMVRQAQDRLGTSARIQWLYGDAEEIFWEPASYDLIVSNATIHWFCTPERTLKRLVSTLRPGGFVAVSTFGSDTFLELNSVLQGVAGKYGLLSVNTECFHSPDRWKNLFITTGLTKIKSHTCWQRLEYTDCYAFLQALKGMGKGYPRFVDQPLSFQRRLLKEITLRYDRAYQQKNGIYATYQSIHLYGRKPTGFLEAL